MAQSPAYPSVLLFGGRVWKSIIPSLVSHGHTVFTPNLTDERTSFLPDHIEQILSIIEKIRQSKVILVAHSCGEMAITGIAARMPERFAQLLLDAATT